MEENLANGLCPELQEPCMTEAIVLGRPTQVGDLLHHVFVIRKLAKVDRQKRGDIVFGRLWVEHIYN
jgi:hypothetical protein